MESHCKLVFILDKSAIILLKELVHNHKVLRMGFLSNYFEQREISGAFKIIPMSPGRVKLIVDKSTLQSGEKESCESLPSFASFHTHPKEAYVTHNVCFTYPSKDDFYSIFYNYVNSRSSIHILSSPEGLYLISLSDEILNNNKLMEEHPMEYYEKQIHDLYRKKYPFNGDSACSSIHTYINEINTIKPCYFVVQFINWENAGLEYTIYYKRNDDGLCLF